MLVLNKNLFLRLAWKSFTALSCCLAEDVSIAHGSSLAAGKEQVCMLVATAYLLNAFQRRGECIDADDACQKTAVST
jgi:hypothetical protein